MPIQINPQVSPPVARKVLALSGKSEGDYYVRAVEINSSVKLCAMKFFQALHWACGNHLPRQMRLFSLQGKNRVCFELVKRDKVKEALNEGCRYVPYAGLAIGLVAGLFYRAAFPKCSVGMLSQAMEAVNAIKQWEIKKIAYLTPLFIPAAIHMVCNLRCGSENKLMQRAVNFMKFGLKRKLAKDPHEYRLALIGLEVNRWVVSSLKVMSATFRTRVPYLFGVAALGLSNALFTQAGSYFAPGFDLSGHCFLKTASAALASSELRAISKKVSTEGSWALLGYAALYALSDAVLMFNTVAYHHTIAESITGVACAALGIWQLDGLTRRVRKQVEKE